MINKSVIHTIVRNRIRAIKHIPYAYKEAFNYNRTAFVAMVFFTPIIFLFAIIFGRSEQDKIKVLVE